MDKANEYFDLKVLLKQGDLDVRGYAAKHEISTEDYFNMLSNLLEQAAKIDYALDKFINRLGDRDAYQDLNIMALLLKKVSCEKYVESIYSTLDAYEKGNWRLASVHAERITDSFKVFYGGLKAARKRIIPESSPDSSLVLKEYLAQLDYIEANRKMLILAVDDSPVILQSVAAVLNTDYKVFTLPKSTMIEAVLSQMTPELILLDYLMPDVNGFELVPVIRDFEEHQDTPIIFLTSEGTIDNITAALALGASDFIVKPFNPEILREKVGKHIKKKKLF